MASPLLWTMRVVIIFTTWFLLATPAPTIIGIFRRKSVGQTPIFPLAAMLASSHMWLLHGYIRHNIFPAVMTFIVGDAIALAYIGVYLRYAATERAHAVRVVGLTLVFLGAASAFAFTAKDDNVVGPVAGLAALVLYGWPFARMQLVLRHKSHAHIPVVLVARATLNNVAWIVYTALDGNWFTFAPHVVMIVLGVAQLGLYALHHPRYRRVGGCCGADKSGGSTSATGTSDADADNNSNSSSSGDGSNARGRVASVSIVIETPKTDLAAGKLVPQSPSYQLLHSPLAPLVRGDSGEKDAVV